MYVRCKSQKFLFNCCGRSLDIYSVLGHILIVTLFISGTLRHANITILTAKINNLKLRLNFKTWIMKDCPKIQRRRQSKFHVKPNLYRDQFYVIDTSTCLSFFKLFNSLSNSSILFSAVWISSWKFASLETSDSFNFCKRGKVEEFSYWVHVLLKQRQI